MPNLFALELSQRETFLTFFQGREAEATQARTSNDRRRNRNRVHTPTNEVKRSKRRK